MRSPAVARFVALCDGSGTRIPLPDAVERESEISCPACGRILGVQVLFGGDVATVPKHNRRREGAPP